MRNDVSADDVNALRVQSQLDVDLPVIMSVEDVAEGVYNNLYLTYSLVGTGIIIAMVVIV